MLYKKKLEYLENIPDTGALPDRENYPYGATQELILASYDGGFITLTQYKRYLKKAGSLRLAIIGVNKPRGR